MDPPYTPFEDLPEKLRREMQLLQYYKDIVNTQAARVANVTVSEWRKAEKRVAASIATRSLDEKRAEDQAAYAASARRRKEPPEAANARAVGQDSTVAEDTDHAGDLGTIAANRRSRKRPRRPPSSGYTGVSRKWDRKLYSARCEGKYLGGHATAAEAAHVYDQYAIERNIAAGYDKHGLNFSKARTKRHTKELLRENTPEPGSDHTGR